MYICIYVYICLYVYMYTRPLRGLAGYSASRHAADSGPYDRVSLRIAFVCLHVRMMVRMCAQRISHRATQSQIGAERLTQSKIRRDVHPGRNKCRKAHTWQNKRRDAHTRINRRREANSGGTLGGLWGDPGRTLGKPWWNPGGALRGPWKPHCI